MGNFYADLLQADHNPFSVRAIFCPKRYYRNVESIEKEWKGYTLSKRGRAVFCDFLFKEGHYERCLANAFQALYKFLMMM